MAEWLKKIIPDKYKKSVNEMHKHTAKLFVIQIVGTILVFGGNVLLARCVGDIKYGIYSAITNWTAIITIFAQMGMEDYHASILPALNVNHDKTKIKQLFIWSNKMVLIAAFSCVLLMIMLAAGTRLFLFHQHLKTFSLGLITMGLFALLSNNIGFLRGLKIIFKGQLIDKILRPGTLLLILLFFLLLKIPLSLDNFFLITMVTAIVCLLSSLVIIQKKIRNINSKSKDANGRAIDKSLRRNMYFIAMSLLSTLSTRLDLLLITVMQPLTDTGYYNVAVKLSDLTGYCITVVNILWPPYLAENLHTPDKGKTFELLKKGAQLTFASTLIIFFIMLVSGGFLLGLYGITFKIATIPLLILCIAKIPIAFIGPVNAQFMVEGREKISVICMIVQVLVLAVSGIFLIKNMGLEGAALSVGLANLVYAALITVYFKRFNKVTITPFGVFNS